MVVANPVHGWSNNAAEGSIKQARAGLIWSGVFMYGTSTHQEIAEVNELSAETK